MPATPNTPGTSGRSKQPNCQYCGSPIPLGSSSCKSCELSGEILKSDVRMAIKSKQKASGRMLFALFVAALLAVGVLGTVIYVRLHR